MQARDIDAALSYAGELGDENPHLYFLKWAEFHGRRELVLWDDRVVEASGAKEFE